MKPHIKLKTQPKPVFNVVTMPNRRDAEGKKCREYLAQCVSQFCESQPQMAGFVIMTWNADGCTHTEVKAYDTSLVQRLMIPHYVSEAARENIMEQNTRELVKTALGE